jgi:RNA polymerase sigma-70 factor (ECF subfamily)
MTGDQLTTLQRPMTIADDPLGPPADGPANGPADGALVRDARDGDQRACTLLVQRFLRKAMAVAMEFVDSREDAEDVVQDAFRSAFHNLHRFDETRAFGPWLFTIVRNTARNALDGRGRRPTEALHEDVAADGVSPLEAAHRRELRSSMESAIASLPTMQRTCFQLCVVEGFTSGEAAAAIGLAESTVRVHVFKARQHLQPLLLQWRDGGQDG